MREIVLHWIYPFQAISSNFGFIGRKPAPPPQDEENVFTLDLSISANFRQLWFYWQKSTPQAVTSSVSCLPSGVNYFIPVISVRASEGATHTSFEVPEQASFKGYFISLVVICVK